MSKFCIAGHTENFEDAFSGPSTDISNISYALYGGLWSYSGWNMANYVVAESTNPSRNLPLTILIGIPFIVLCYVMVNIGYLTVLTPAQISSSNAVAVVSECSFKHISESNDEYSGQKGLFMPRKGNPAQGYFCHVFLRHWDHGMSRLPYQGNHVFDFFVI